MDVALVLHRRPLHDGPPRRRRSPAELVGAGTVIPCHYDTFPPIETDAQAFKSDVESQTASKSWRSSSRARRSSSAAVEPALEPERQSCRSCASARRRLRGSTPVAVVTRWPRSRRRRSAVEPIRRLPCVHGRLAYRARPQPALAAAPLDGCSPAGGATTRRPTRRRTTPTATERRDRADARDASPSTEPRPASPEDQPGARATRSRPLAGAVHRRGRADHAARGARAGVHLDPRRAALRRRAGLRAELRRRDARGERRPRLGVHDDSTGCARARRSSGTPTGPGNPVRIEATAEPGP